MDTSQIIQVRDMYPENSGEYENLSVYEFNKVAQPSVIGENGGFILDGSPIQDPDFKNKLFVLLKKPDEDIVIPRYYQQFTEVVERAVEHHYGVQGHKTDDMCMLQVEQRHILEGDIMPFNPRHIDGACVNDDGDVKQGENYLITTALDPYFFNNEIDVNIKDVATLCTSLIDWQTSDVRVLEAFYQDKYTYEGADRYGVNTMVHYNNATVHESVVAKEDTFKTLVVVRFSPV